MDTLLIRDLPRFDAAGFLAEPEAWNEDVARRIAAFDGLGEITPAQWSVIRVLRSEYAHNPHPPALPHACRLAGCGPSCMDELFPGAREAWRIAGLPDPGEEAKSYM
jgi:tRNA 2-thiouridine synthesizing protein E